MYAELKMKHGDVSIGKRPPYFKRSFVKQYNLKYKSN